MKKIFLLLAFLCVIFGTGLFNAQSGPTPSACASNLFGIQQLAPWYCNNIDTAVANIWQQWLPIGMLVITVAFMIAALIFMFGIALRNQRVREFGVGELYEATATAIIIIAFMFLTSIMIGLVPALLIGPANPFVTSLTYISQTIGQVDHVVTALFNISLPAAYYSSFSLKVAIAGSNSFGSIIAALASPITDFATQAFASSIQILFIIPAQTIAYLLMDGLLVLNIEYYLLIFGMYAAIPVFLLPGALLRAFTPTRSVGGMFMAIAIGFFFIMPILFSVAFFFTQAGVATSLTTASNQLNQFGQGVGAEQNAISASSPLITTLNNLQGSMGPFWLSVLFYPALIMAITYFGITTIADFIGGFAHGTGGLVAKM
ncbi:MAG: hypothetical protein ACREBF_01525 [Candidatus Micrarchaeales archaeon]